MTTSKERETDGELRSELSDVLAGEERRVHDALSQNPERTSVRRWGEPREYVTDDRDDEDRGKLVIFPGENGDWYVATMPEGDRHLGEKETNE